MLPIKSRPRSMDRVRKGLRFFAGAVMSCRPRRSASFTRSLKLASRARRNRSNSAATSSSIVSVVLMHQDIRTMMPCCNELRHVAVVELDLHFLRYADKVDEHAGSAGLWIAG